MSFTEWYKETYKEEWHEDYAGLNEFCYKVSCEYDNHCKENKIKPIWNG